MSPSLPRMSSARLAAVVLIGVAVIAVGLGVFDLTSNASGGSSASGAPSPGSSAVTTGHTPATPSTTSPASISPTTTTVVPSTTGGQSTTAGSAAGAPSPAPVAVQVYNNSLIKGLAEKAAAEFRAAGYNVTIVGNYAATVLPTSTALYTTQDEKQVADQLAQQFHLQVQQSGPDFAGFPPGVIVVLAKDFDQGSK